MQTFTGELPRELRRREEAGLGGTERQQAMGYSATRLENIRSEQRKTTVAKRSPQWSEGNAAEGVPYRIQGRRDARPTLKNRQRVAALFERAAGDADAVAGPQAGPDFAAGDAARQ